MTDHATLVACLGASITAAKGSFDWIGELERRPRNSAVRFRNFGIGGDLAYNALQRLPEVMACHPNTVIVLVGDNDVIALVSRRFRRVARAWKHLPRTPSPEWFRENIQCLTRRLRAGSSVRVALCSLVPIGEDPDSPNPLQREFNLRIADYSGIIKQVAMEEGVGYVPAYERMDEQIRALPGAAFTAFRFLPFYRDAFRHLVLRVSLDQIAQRNGWRFHTDGIHQQPRRDDPGRSRAGIHR
jgi:lysophospholipase L1-like esterase